MPLSFPMDTHLHTLQLSLLMLTLPQLMVIQLQPMAIPPPLMAIPPQLTDTMPQSTMPLPPVTDMPRLTMNTQSITAQFKMLSNLQRFALLLLRLFATQLSLQSRKLLTKSSATQ